MTAVSSLNPTPIIDTHFIPTVAPHVLTMKCEIKPTTGHQMNWWTIAVARHAYPCISPIAEASWVQAPPTCWTPFFIYNLSSSPCNHSISSKAAGGRQKEKLKIWAIYKPEIQWGLPSSHIPPLYSILSVLTYSISFPHLFLDIFNCIISHMIQASELGLFVSLPVLWPLGVYLEATIASQ